jgi:sporulation integral membrane protein YtvI
VTEAVNLLEDTPQYINELSNLSLQYQDKWLHASRNLPTALVNEVGNEVQNALISVKDSLLQYLDIQKISALLANIPNFLMSFLVFLISLFLFMIDLPKLRETLFSHMTEETASKANFMASRLSYVVFGFLKAQFLVSLLIFFVTLIGLLLITPKVAIVMAFILWVIDLVPIIGSNVILAPWAFFHLITGDVSLGTKLAILSFILLIIRRTVEPKVMGRHIGLSPLATLVAMYLGLKLFGIIGMIIGPLVLILFNSAKEAGIIKMKFRI